MLSSRDKVMNKLWNTFDKVRDELENQYHPMLLHPGSGMADDDLKTMTNEYFESHRDRPHIETRAKILAMILEHARIGVDPRDWFADHIAAGTIMNVYGKKWEAEANIPPEQLAGQALFNRCGVGKVQLDLSHTSPDWRNILELGVKGLRDRALRARKCCQHAESQEFYSAVATVYDGLRRFIIRLAAEAERVNAVRVIETLKHLADYPPQNFQQALQLTYIFNQVQEIEGELVRAMGSFDRLYLEFYRRDLKEKRLTRDQAKELIKFFWLKFLAQKQSIGKNFCFGGIDGDGRDVCNELTILGYEAYFEMRTWDPKLTLRVHKNTPDHILKQAARCLKKGYSATVFANDEVAFEMFRRRGKAPEDLSDFILIGCYEPAIMGKEISCSMEITFNLAKPLELALFNGRDPLTGEQLGLACQDAGNYVELEKEYFRQLEYLLNQMMEWGRRNEKMWKFRNPSPLLSGSMTDCILNGRDISEGGTKYNTSGVMCAAIADATDSLAAIKFLYEKSAIQTIAEFKDILANGWNGFDQFLHQVLHHSPRWGNNDDGADAIARRITDFAARLINNTPNSRGGGFQMGLWSINLNHDMGRKTGALPDGRKSGEPLAKNTCSCIGMDRRGVSSLINSVAKLDHAEFPDGSVLDVMLHPSLTSGPDGEQIICDLIRTYFAKGGLAIQFNILSAWELKEAQRHPEEYANLQVRVCGWNARFVGLSHEEQEAFIAQAEAIP